MTDFLVGMHYLDHPFLKDKRGEGVLQIQGVDQQGEEQLSANLFPKYCVRKFVLTVFSF